MVEYNVHKLGEICKRFSSGKGISAELIYEDGLYPVIGGNGLRGYTDTYNFDGECAVIGRQGAYCGNVIYFSGKGYMTEHAVVTEPTIDNNAKYLSYKLSGLQLGRFSGQAAQPGLSVTKLSRLRIEMPSKDYQDKVANILSAYDILIEINNKRIKSLEQMAENLYKEWFVRFRFPGHEIAEFKNGIPKGWRIKRMKEYGRVETGKTPSTEVVDNYGEDIMFVKTPDMHGNTFVIYTEEYLSQIGHQTQPKKLLPRKSIMVTCIGTGGVVALNSEQAHTNQQINSIVPDNDLYLEWLFFSCKNLKPTIEMYGATGTTMTNLSKGKFEKLKIIEPPEELVLSFHRVVCPILKRVEQLSYLNQNLVKQRDLLLPRLMSGKLEV